MLSRRCAVVGSPISHSLSPTLHRAAYVSLGLEWSYDAIEVGAGHLADFVAGLDASWCGLSVTMPLKDEAVHLGTPTKVARLTGVANTVVFDTGRVSNTDAPGLALALRNHQIDDVSTATILGGGATAKSTLVGLADLGLREATVVLRTPSRLTELAPIADALGIRLRAVPWGGDLPDVDVCVSTVIAAAADSLAEQVAASAAVVFDIIYDPWPTALASAAQDAARVMLGGLDLLVGQAVLQVQAMTRQRVDPDILLSAGRAEARRRAGA